MAKTGNAGRRHKSIKLLRSLEVARGRLYDRIQIGLELSEVEIKEPRDLKHAKDNYYTWDEYNQALVGQLTDDDDFIYHYRDRVGLYGGSVSYQAEVDGLRRDIRSKVRRLDSIREQLELYAPEQTEGVGSQQSEPYRPKIFIAHGGHSEARDHLELVLWRNGMRPIIVEEMPSLGRNLDDKVRHYMGVSEFAVVFAEVERASEQDGRTYPRLNIIDEIARVRETLKSRFIVVLEAGLDLPINEAGAITWERFNHDDIEKAFAAILREIHAHGLAGTAE